MNDFSKRIHKRGGAGSGVGRLTWHTLHHTFASRLAMSVATDYDISACLRKPQYGIGTLVRPAGTEPATCGFEANNDESNAS